MRVTIAALAILLFAPVSLYAQSQADECAHFKENIDAIVARTPAQPNQDFVLALLDVGAGTRCFAEYAAERSLLLDFVRRFEGSRTDKQSGAAAGAVGSTSVVSQGPVARVLSVATEYGALTQSINGQVITVRGNAAGLPTALIAQNLVPYCVPMDRFNRFCIGTSTLGILRRFSFAVSFNAKAQEAVGTNDAAAPASPAGQPVVFEAAKNQLASASLRVELWKQKDATSDAFLKKWTADVGTAMNTAGADLMKNAGDFATPVMDTDDYKDWRTAHAAAIRAAGTDRERIVAELHRALADLMPIMRNVTPALDEKALASLAAYNTFFRKQDELIAEIAEKSVVAFEYTNSRPASAPHTSNARLIIDAPLTAKDKLVANLAVTWFDTSQINTDGQPTKYRDAQAGIQYEHGLGEIAIIGPATVSAALYYQYQHAPSLLKVDPLKPIPGVTFVGLPDGANTVFATKGDIILGQVKLSLTPHESSVKVPLAVTYSNRTELIDKPTWRAQIGVTYDFDSLFARGK